VLNASQAVHLDTPTYKLHPLNDFAIAGDVEIWAMGGADCELYIDGSFTPKASLAANNYLYVSEDAIIDTAVTLYRDMAVGGDLRVQKPSGGSYTATTGYLALEAGVTLSVFGDFYTQSSTVHWFGRGTEANPSTLELYGDFRHVGADTYLGHYSAGGFKLALYGEGVQTISLGNTANTSLGLVGAWNEGGICFASPVGAFTADFDLSIASDYPIGSLNLNGYVVTLASDATVGSANLAGGVLACEGDLTLTGAVNFNAGQIYAENDVTIAPGGSLSMANGDDALIVLGDLVVNATSNIYLVNGYLDLKGDLTVNSNVNFTTSTAVHAQFSGSGPQTVTYPSGRTVMFGSLAFTGDDPYHVTVYKGGYVPVTNIYTNQGDLYELEDILEAVVKVEFEVVEIPQAMQAGALAGGGGSFTANNANVRVIFTSFCRSAKNVFFVYDKAGSDFILQAGHIAYTVYKYVNCELIYLSSESDFVDEWNELSSRNDIQNIFLFLHGGPGKIFFYEETMTYSDIETLDSITITGKAYLLTCHGGTEFEESTVAYKLSEKLNRAGVRAAVDGKVSYVSWEMILDYYPFLLWPCTKTADSYWADFYTFSNDDPIIVSGKGRMPFPPLHGR
jgi:hypothetical protein